MKVIGVIPARLKSKRLVNKVLKPISGKPLIWYVWQQAKNASLLDRVIIACCDKEVEEVALSFGAEVLVTNPEHKSGTDRVAEVASRLDCDIILNIQGDEPLIKPETLNQLACFLIDNPTQVMATIAFAAGQQEQFKDPNVVKVVVDKENNALYFSRSLVPYDLQGNAQARYFKHIGIYAYRRDFLLKLSEMEQTYLERMEKLEQLRVLENRIGIKVVEIDYDTVSVDTEEDFRKAEEKLKRVGKNV